jgi:hypothetical protein
MIAVQIEDKDQSYDGLEDQTIQRNEYHQFGPSAFLSRRGRESSSHDRVVEVCELPCSVADKALKFKGYERKGWRHSLSDYRVKGDGRITTAWPDTNQL